jgi:hypothetical protein
MIVRSVVDDATPMGEVNVADIQCVDPPLLMNVEQLYVRDLLNNTSL